MAEIQYTSKKLLRIIPSLFKDFINNNITYRFVDTLPTVMVFNVTSKCNSQCVMCDIWKNKDPDDMNTETVKKIFSDKFFKNMEIVGISGGEPTLRNDLEKIVEVIGQNTNKLQKLIVTSNGLNTDRMSKQIKSVADYCHRHHLPFSFRISLDGLEESHNEVRRVPDAYQKAMKSITTAKGLSKEYDFSFGISSTFTPMNVYDARKLQELADDIGVDAAYYFAWQSDASFRNEELAQSIVLDDDAREYLAGFYLERLLECSSFDGGGYSFEAQINRLKNNTDRVMLCPFSNQGLMLDANGDVHYCLNSKVIGNVLKTPIQQIFFDKKNIEYRKTFPETLCKKCDAGCMAQVAARKKIYPYLFYLARLACIKMRNKEKL